MNLWDLLEAAQYDQDFSIYVTNAYDQNVPVSRGKVPQLFNLDCGEYRTFMHLMDKVEYYHITEKGRMVVFLRDAHYEENASYNYGDDYVKRWDNYKPETRPWLHSVETEVYTDKYINHFSEGE